MRLLITGGAGFIGANLARLASEEGADVVALDNLSTGSIEALAGIDLEFIEASVLDETAVASALVGVDSIVHLAALPSVPRSIQDPMASHANNATGTLCLLEQARSAGVQHVVVASSSSVYGMNPAMPKNEREWVRPMSPYAVSKLATEQYALAYQQSFGMHTLALRFFNVYGPGQTAGHAYAAVIPVFIDALLADMPVPMHGDGQQSRDFTFVGTVCAVLLDAASRRVTHPEPVNLAFGTNTTLLEALSVIERVAGRTAKVSSLPRRNGDVKHSQADNGSLRSLFPAIEPVTLDRGIEQTVAWLDNRLRTEINMISRTAEQGVS